MLKKLKIVTLFIIMCILFTGCGNKSASNIDKKINLNAPKDIKVESYYSYDNSSLILKLTNEGSNDYKDLDIITEYPYKERDLISDDEILIKNLRANSSTYVSLMLPIDNNFAPYIPNKIDLSILTESENIEDIADTSSMVDLIKFDYDIEDNSIYYTITNNTGKIIGTVNNIVVYFKDGKPIATDYIDAYDVEETFSSDQEILYYETIGNLDEEDDEGGDVKYIDYDNIEIYTISIFDDYVEDSGGEYSPEEEEILDDEDYE